ncbi:MAG: arginine--tRNA ligase [Firmicutes bacterium]|nr:arginine--tRNA ligase [Bacillota bacterium]MDD7602532.1 arginine--tRNA ligase [Bacillota bacterium]MDY5856794.1 arginine--tRNA ligase [Anaerovoracaceae bacterium]
MVNFKEEISKLIAEQVPDLSPEEIQSMIEVPQDTRMGDYAFPCFRLAKTLRKAPPLIAKGIAEGIRENAMFEKVEQVNAYVNMFISREEFVGDVVSAVLKEGEDYGKTDVGEGKTVIVEFSSPNIAKPFHIGHIRSTVIGNSISKIYKALGYNVIRINHLGDYGTQFGKMICAYRHWGKKEDVVREPIKTLLSYYTKFHEEVETHPELDDEAREIFAKLEHGEPEEVELWQWFRDESLKEFNRVYKMLGIDFDSYNGESFYSDKMPRFVKELEEKGLLEESQGAHVVNLEKYGLGVALITKSDGSTLYITRDIAAAVYRKETYDFYKNIYVVASQQNLHFQQWIQILELMGYEWARDCVHVPFGLVSLEDGTMSTRHGRVVFLEDVLNRAVEKTREIIEEKGVATENIDETAKQVGIGAVIFNELSNNRIKDYVFSWDKVLDFNGETGPYVQYTYARCASVLRNAGEEAAAKAADPAALKPQYLTSESAFQLVRLLYKLPEVIREAGDRYEPSIVTRHIVDIAQSFNRFYHDEHILVEDEEEKTAKLALVLAAKTAIRNGLALLGMEAPERM